MAAPGSLEARYEQLAGTEDRRRELYIARRHLRFTIDEWLALPWWQRRVYVEGMRDEAEDRQADTQPRTANSGLDAIYHGTLGDVAATTAFTTA